MKIYLLKIFQFLKNKIYRLQASTNYLKLIKLYHILFKEKFKKEIKIPEIYNGNIHRSEILNKIIDMKKFKDYLEIGCDQNELFEKIIIENKIGIDPHNGGTHRMTSDAFFKDNKKKFDIIFIDGLHSYKQVKQDIENSLNCIRNNGFVLLHDCFPFTYYDQAMPRAQRKWNGDVWKSIVQFRERDDLSTLVGAFDNGIGLIYKKKNKNKLFLNKNIGNTTYQDYFFNYQRYLNLVDYKYFFKEIDEFK